MIAPPRTSRQKGGRNQVSPGRNFLLPWNLNSHWPGQRTESILHPNNTSNTSHLFLSICHSLLPAVFFHSSLPWHILHSHIPLLEILQGLLIALRRRRKIPNLPPRPVLASSQGSFPLPLSSGLMELLALPWKNSALSRASHHLFPLSGYPTPCILVNSYSSISGQLIK